VSRCRQATSHVYNTRGCKYSLDAPDDELKFRSKHVEQPRNNKLSYTVASCWSFSYIISWCTEPRISSQLVSKIMTVCLYSCLNIKRMCSIVGCVMSGSSVFSHYPTNSKIFGKILLNMCLDFLHNFCLKHLSLQEEFSEISQPYKGLHVKYPLFLLDFN
jgi:hypothetical protein